MRRADYLPYRDELCIAAAGPLANFLAAMCTVALVALVGAFDGALFFTVCNLALALLNLMPVSGLDGGRMLSALVLPAMGLARGETLLSVVSAVASAGHSGRRPAAALCDEIQLFSGPHRLLPSGPQSTGKTPRSSLRTYPQHP